MMNEANGWSEYQRLVLSELKRLDEAIRSNNERLEAIQLNIAVLKTKATIWGALAGFGGSIIVVIVGMLLQ
jgi:ABC-type branched-subunit amino acid transport system permease subunit